MDANKTVTAHFTQNQYTLTITINGNGSVTKVPDQATYTYGTPVQLTANPDPGWSFDHWSGNLAGSQNPDTIIMNANRSVTAHFTQDQYTLTITTDGSGTVTKVPDQSTYTYGTLVQLTANPDSGWLFDHWSGNLTGSQNPDTILMNGNKAVTAHFTQSQYSLNINVVGNGSVEKNPDQSFYDYGDEVELTAVPDSGWLFSEWSGDLSGSVNPETLLIDDDKDVTATFEPDVGVYETENLPPTNFALLHISSNPVRKESAIEYHLPVGQDVMLRIYNLRGQVIRELVSEYRQAGRYQVIWDGRDSHGQEVCSGIYFYHIQTEEGYKETRKLLLLR